MGDRLGLVGVGAEEFFGPATTVCVEIEDDDVHAQPCRMECAECQGIDRAVSGATKRGGMVESTR